MVDPKNVQHFRTLMAKSRTRKDSSAALGHMVEHAKSYSDNVLTPLRTEPMKEADVSSQNVGGYYALLEADRNCLISFGVEFPNLPLDQFCETLIAAASP